MRDFGIMNRKCICPDIVAGRDGEFWFSKEERKKQSMENLHISDTEDGKETIVIVLESPHVEEFKGIELNNEGEAIASPALGYTGANLQNYFTKYNLEKVFADLGIKDKKVSDSRIVLMNSIQYQCSRGLDTRIYRDCEWIKLWFGGFNARKDFCTRIKLYNPDIIFNFCTKGNHTLEPKYFEFPQGCKTIINKKYIEYCLKNEETDNNFWEQFCDHKKYTIQGFVSDAIKDCFFEKRDVQVFNGYHPSCWTCKGMHVEKC